MTVQTAAERTAAEAVADGVAPARAALRAGPVTHLLLALSAITKREVGKFVRQKGRWASALVRPLLWLIVFAAGFRSLLGVSIVPPYETYVTYQEYILPGLLGIVLLFYGMQSSLSMVYDREMGIMRLLLTAPLPRWVLLLFKLLSATFLAVIQSYVFLLIVFAVSYYVPYLGVRIPASGWIYILPPLIAGGLMLAALGLLLSVYIRQLENFAGTMNFVIFPMFFISPALYPLWKLREQGAEFIYWIAQINPFTHTIELIRFAAYGKTLQDCEFQFRDLEFFRDADCQFLISLAVVFGFALVFFIVAVIGYDPQRGMLRRSAALDVARAEIKKAVGGAFGFVFKNLSTFVRLVWLPVAILLGLKMAADYFGAGAQQGFDVGGQPSLGVSMGLWSVQVVFLSVFGVAWHRLAKRRASGEDKPVKLSFGIAELQYFASILVLAGATVALALGAGNLVGVMTFADFSVGSAVTMAIIGGSFLAAWVALVFPSIAMGRGINLLGSIAKVRSNWLLLWMSVVTLVLPFLFLDDFLRRMSDETPVMTEQLVLAIPVDILSLLVRFAAVALVAGFFSRVFQIFSTGLGQEPAAPGPAPRNAPTGPPSGR